MSYEKSTVLSIMSRIRDEELVLPAIQRDFIWQPERMHQLIDSILRGYPFGTLLFWNTRQRVQYREFVKDWRADHTFTFRVKEEGRKKSFVLDGQQRLQTLYLALYGTYEGDQLYLDLLSGETDGDVSELRFESDFLKPGVASQRNSEHRGRQLWVPLRDIAELADRHQLVYRRQELLSRAGLDPTSAAGVRLQDNLERTREALRSAESINYYTVDKDYGEDGQVTPLDEVLEIFVRMNSGGQVLSKSDLMFSLIQLHWEGAYEAIADVVDALNEKGRFEFDRDFVLKTALVCAGKGARYDVAKFRDQASLESIRHAFPAIREALINAVDFLVNDARFFDGRVLGSYNALIPFVYFLYRQPGQLPHGERTRLEMKQLLYLILMLPTFTRAADSRIDGLVQRVLNPAHTEQPGVFPAEQIRQFLRERDVYGEIDERLLQNNIPILMNILEGGARLPEGRRAHRAEYDHIFPRSRLAEIGFSDDQINDYANFRLVSKHDNIWKSNKDPRPYFAEQPEVAALYLIPTDLLDLAQYPHFLAARRRLIRERVDAFFGSGATAQTTQPLVSAPRVPAPTLAETPAQHALTPQQEHELMRLVLTRHPLAETHRVLFQTLWRAYPSEIAAKDLETALGVSGKQFSGVMGSLGRRINKTAAILGHTKTGIDLLVHWQQDVVTGEWRCSMRPEFRALLESEPDMRRVALGDQS
jgi:hypothetical protein